MCAVVKTLLLPHPPLLPPFPRRPCSRILAWPSGLESKAPPPPPPGTCTSVMELLFMVMPRTCSSSRESRNRSSPARRGWIRPLLAIRWSDSVVLPWSTCASTHTFLMRSCTQGVAARGGERDSCQGRSPPAEHSPPFPPQPQHPLPWKPAIPQSTHAHRLALQGAHHAGVGIHCWVCDVSQVRCQVRGCGLARRAQLPESCPGSRTAGPGSLGAQAKDHSCPPCMHGKHSKTVKWANAGAWFCQSEAPGMPGEG